MKTSIRSVLTTSIARRRGARSPIAAYWRPIAAAIDARVGDHHAAGPAGDVLAASEAEDARVTQRAEPAVLRVDAQRLGGILDEPRRHAARTPAAHARDRRRARRTGDAQSRTACGR
jgi:hypothetical protein